MNGLFESQVYELERAAPYANVSLVKFMMAKADAAGGSEVVLTVRQRSSTQSRRWFTLSWWEVDWRTGKQARHEVAAQRLDQLGWRAVQTHKNLVRARELAQTQASGQPQPEFTEGGGI